MCHTNAFVLLMPCATCPDHEHITMINPNMDNFMSQIWTETQALLGPGTIYQPYLPPRSQHHSVLHKVLTLKALLYEDANEMSRKGKCNSKEKYNSLSLLIHSLPSNRSSSVDVVTLEITICDYYKPFQIYTQ
jgi:hypothetical protein